MRSKSFAVCYRLYDDQLAVGKVIHEAYLAGGTFV
jgi:hypothetical protein